MSPRRVYPRPTSTLISCRFPKARVQSWSSASTTPMGKMAERTSFAWWGAPWAKERPSSTLVWTSGAVTATYSAEEGL